MVKGEFVLNTIVLLSTKLHKIISQILFYLFIYSVYLFALVLEIRGENCLIRRAETYMALFRESCVRRQRPRA